jgi:hypothetical protein
LPFAFRGKKGDLASFRAVIIFSVPGGLGNGSTTGRMAGGTKLGRDMPRIARCAIDRFAKAIRINASANGLDVDRMGRSWQDGESSFVVRRSGAGQPGTGWVGEEECRIMDRWVEITFDCLPLRSVTRLDIPLDASPKFRARCESIKRAMERHGSHNSYYLYNAQCVFHVTNRADIGAIQFAFEGTVLTDAADQKTLSADLEVQLLRETCDWLTEPIIPWFRQTVNYALLVEFDRYIAAGDLAKTRERLARLQATSDQAGGYVGMYL